MKAYEGGANPEGIFVKTAWGTGIDERSNEEAVYIYMQVTAATEHGYWLFAVDETGSSSGHVDTQTAIDPQKVRRTGDNGHFDGRVNYASARPGFEAFVNCGIRYSGNNKVYEFRVKLYTLDKNTAADSIIGLNFSISDSNQKKCTLNGNDWGNYVNLFNKYQLSEEFIESERQITLKTFDNTLIDTAKVESGSEYTLPEYDFENGLPFLGWSVGDQLLPAGAKITVTQNITIRAFSIGLAMEDGAAIRLTETTGMRWITYLDINNLHASANILSKGVLIVPVEYLKDGMVEFTHAGLEADGKVANAADGYIDVVATDYVAAGETYKNANGRKQFNAEIAEIQEANYETDYVAVGYVKVQYSDGTEAYIYADYSECARNVKYIATQAIADEGVYSADEIALLNTFVGQ